MKNKRPINRGHYSVSYNLSNKQWGNDAGLNGMSPRNQLCGRTLEKWVEVAMPKAGINICSVKVVLTWA